MRCVFMPGKGTGQIKRADGPPEMRRQKSVNSPVGGSQPLHTINTVSLGSRLMPLIVVSMSCSSCSL